MQYRPFSLVQKDDIAICRMRDDIDDYRLMAKWLSDEKVLEFYGGRDNPYSLEQIIEEYAPAARGEEPVVPCFCLYQNLPIGYLQYYLLTEADKQNYGDYGVGEMGNIYGIDLFIGETEYRNQGIGSKLLLLLLTYLFEELKAAKAVIDPQIGNTRAIRCYEKCGFRKIKRLSEHELHEGKYWDSWLMAIERQNQ